MSQSSTPLVGPSLLDIQQELANTEVALSKVEQSESTANEEHRETPLEQLLQMDQTADELLLAKDVSVWMQSFAPQDEKDDRDEPQIIQEAQRCEALGQLLRRHPPLSEGSLYDNLFTGEFLPTLDYVKSMLLLQLRKSLRQVDYPSPKACAELLQALEEDQSHGAFQNIATAAEWMNRLDLEHDLVISHIQGTSVAQSSSKLDDVVRELLRPFVERIRHHFVVVPLNSTSEPQKQQSPHKKVDRIERLPEWLFAFVKEHIFSEDGPWDLIHYGLTPIVRPELSVDFLNELIRCLEWVFSQRNFFRHPKIAGPHSQPALLCSAVEQLLQFDDFLMNQLSGSKVSAGRVLSLMDIYVASDEELLQWWMERERESVFDSLFRGKIVDDKDLMPQRVSPRAELFCSLLRSIKRKATVFSFSGPYLSHVAAPLCMQFLDAVHEAATDLKSLLFNQRRLPTVLKLQSNLKEWVELINGTHMSAQLLMQEESHGLGDEVMDTSVAVGKPRSSAHQDLQRFGSSLERLKQVFVEEFATLFVENILLEKARMASYLMRCSHLLSTDMDDEDAVDATELSPDLGDTFFVLETFLTTLDEAQLLRGNATMNQQSDTFYASQALRDRVLTLLSEKLLEVALDWHGTTPSITLSGAQAFANDVQLLMGDSLLPPTAMRLLDVAKCLCLDATQLSVMGDALCGLAGQAPPLTEDLFAVDDRIFEEALSMVRAKNLVFLQLGDFLSVLNRRVDLSYISAY